MKRRNIIVIGASSGGFEALKIIVKQLPANINASIFVVWHMSAEVRGILPTVFNKLNTIKTKHAEDKDLIHANQIYIAPPDHHLTIEGDYLRVTKGPKENRFRPAVDPLFRSAAYTFGNRVIGVVLSGALDDGSAGLWRIKANGGIAIVQDPKDAEVPSMPQNALNKVKVDHCVPVSAIADLLVKLSSEEIPPNTDHLKDEKTEIEIGIATGKNGLNKGSLNIGVLSPFTCPDCHGVVSKITDGDITRFRCHTGHAYSENSLMAALEEKIEESLYSALRSLDESILLFNHIGDHHAEDNLPKLAATCFTKARTNKLRSDLVRKAISNNAQLD